MVLDQKLFYGESGGQVGDSGELSFVDGHAQVSDTQKVGHAIVHHVHIDTGKLTLGSEVHAHVADELRHASANNHSVTHLLHAALREILGTHVTQKGC